MGKMTVADLDVANKRVLVRVDFNVPVDPETGAILNDSRIRGALPTINHLISKSAKVILATHFGRPQGKVVESMRLDKIAQRLQELLGKPVKKINAVIGAEAEEAAAGLEPGGVLMLENVRFHKGEEANDPEFARALANLADIYVDDAFGTAHRAHASTEGVARYLPAVSGFLMQKEIEMLGMLLTDPPRPFGALLGGAKVSTKIAVLKNLLGKIDALFLGGGMANTFLKAKGYDLGASLVEQDKVDFAKSLIEEAETKGIRLLLPVDAAIADKFSATAKRKTVAIDQIPSGWMAMDIGPKTVEAFGKELRRCKAVIWNGPLGVAEFRKFSLGTEAVAAILAEAENTITVVGGGETAAAIEEMGFADDMTHVSTGGGASLEFLEGQTLPGVAILKDKSRK